VEVSEELANESAVNETGNYTLHARLDGLELQEIEEGKLDNPTLEIWVPEDALEQLIESNSPVETFNELLKQERIQYESHGFMNAVGFAMMKGIFKVAKLFGFL